MTKPTVAILRTTPESVLEDYPRLLKMASPHSFYKKNKANQHSPFYCDLETPKNLSILLG